MASDIRITAINNTGSPIDVYDLGISIPASSQRALYLEFSDEDIASSLDLKSYVESGDVIIHDGTKNLSVSEALEVFNQVIGYEVDKTIGESDRYIEYIRTGNLVTSIVEWTDSGKTKKIREEIYTRINGLISQVQIKDYDEDGNLTTTKTTTINRIGSLVSTETVEVS